MIEPNHLGLPPWKSPDSWSQAIWSIEYTVKRHGAKFQEARKQARHITTELAIINTSINAVCQTTCMTCMDICCKKATIWYDFKDLLYMHLDVSTFPKEQISRQPGAPCCNLTPSGCRLNRNERPFICTWYTCPLQTARMSEKCHQNNGTLIKSSLNRIKTARFELERSFVKAVHDSFQSV